MKKKKKFKPVIYRIRLNPEQAVLACCGGGRAGPDETCGYDGPDRAGLAS